MSQNEIPLFIFIILITAANLSNYKVIPVSIALISASSNASVSTWLQVRPKSNQLSLVHQMIKQPILNLQILIFLMKMSFGILLAQFVFFSQPGYNGSTVFTFTLHETKQANLFLWTLSIICRFTIGYLIWWKSSRTERLM